MSVSKKVLRRMKKVMGVIGAVPILAACSSQISRAAVNVEFISSTRTLRFSGNGVIDKSWQKGWGGLYNPDFIRRVVIEDGIEKIGDDAFLNCESLKEITIPHSVTSIGRSAFSGCESLKEITIPNSIATIGDDAFSACISLKEITIPNSVTSIGDRAFSCCYSLKKINIPNSVTSIGEEAFSGCKSLTEIKIPTSVTVVGASAFADCEELMTVEFEGFEKNSRAFKLLDLCYEKDKREYEAKKRDKILSKIRQTTWNNLKPHILKFFYKKPIEIAEVGKCAFGNCKKLSCLDTDGRKVKCYANVFYNTPLKHLENEFICGKYIAKP